MSKRKRNIIESVMHYNSIMLLLMVVLIGFGVFALINMPKNEFPSFTIRQAWWPPFILAPPLPRWKSR